MNSLSEMGSLTSSVAAILHCEPRHALVLLQEQIASVGESRQSLIAAAPSSQINLEGTD